MLCSPAKPQAAIMTLTQRLAAVDLGSNSFRLEIGQRTDQGFERSDYFKETVRLGGGLDDEGRLSAQAMQTAWDCLARFGQRLLGFAGHEVRAVATQTLREARNGSDFLDRAQVLLGFPIEVISGQDEALLIYQGVACDLQAPDERRLVLDIGGRSTEIIVGQGAQAHWLQSLPLGSVAWSQRHFADGCFTVQAFAQADCAAKALLHAQLDSAARPEWTVAYGAAGTVNAVADVLAQTDWDAQHITPAALDWLYEQLLIAQSVDRITLPGLREDRKPVIGGGLSLLRALMDVLQIEVLTHTSAGLRHGLLQSMMSVRNT
jgi:exopolyphosphatase/guanosine-5'-triphosphate,3'-diphosphate pyrophosphatase